jgi:hypothetical protein
MSTPYQEALAEWTGILAQLWTGIGKPIDPERLKIYRDQLKNVPLGLLELSINRVMKNTTWHTVPPVGVVWQAIRKELNNPYDIDIAVTEWVPTIKRSPDKAHYQEREET